MEREIHHNALRLVIRDEDLPAENRTALVARQNNTRMLGGDDDTKSFWDGVTKAILNRLSSVTPAGFRLKEVELNFEIDGKIFGTGVGGNVSVTLVRDEQ